jgi:hypothetical protein
MCGSRKTSNKSTAVYTDELPDCADNSGKDISTTLREQSKEKYFDYFVFNIVDYGVNCGLLCSGVCRRSLA